jgi:pyridoxal phosphate enzyme (YggS family)
MFVNKESYLHLFSALQEKNVSLVAVSKTKPVAAIEELYALGHRDFGENYVQELLSKSEVLPKDIRWHFIGHLQSNKVKQIISFVHLIHGVDSEKLLEEIQKQALKAGCQVDVLLQMHIAKEETKYGLDEKELSQILTKIKNGAYPNVNIRGLMGMASFTENIIEVSNEFKELKMQFDYANKAIGHPNFDILSMGMSGDYQIAMEEGSNMVRIGSLLFGQRK